MLGCTATPFPCLALPTSSAATLVLLEPHPCTTPHYTHPCTTPRYTHPCTTPCYTHPCTTPCYTHPCTTPRYTHPTLHHPILLTTGICRLGWDGFKLLDSLQRCSENILITSVVKCRAGGPKEARLTGPSGRLSLLHWGGIRVDRQV